jgi:hypothetical protein
VEPSKNKDGVETIKQTAWTQAVRNRIRQKAGEIQAHRAYEKGAEKWRKEHMPRKGKGNISAEGQELLEDKEVWGNETTLRGSIHDSRKRERSNVDGVFMSHQRGPIISTFTADWFLREGQGRELLGEWMKKTAVKSQDQRRMLQANSHTFPTNSWRHKITKGRESDRCDLCRTLWMVEGRFRTEEELPKQTLGHIQHTCEALSAAHIDAHHQCWRLIHGELARLAAPEWKFLCISGEKCLQTIWDEITTDFKDVQYLNLTQETIWNEARTREMAHPLKSAEHKRIQEGTPRETVMKESFWRMRPDGIAVLPPAGNKTDTFCILEHKRMSDCCEHYLVRAKKTADNQYASLRSAIGTVMQRQGWKVDQVSFITGVRSVDVVHQGDSKKGHYITFLKPAGGPHWALLDDDTVKWVQEKEVLGQEATILVYTRPDGVVETEAIISPDDGQEDRSHREMDDSGSVTATIVIPDDGQEERSHREMDDSGSVMVTTGNNTLGKAVRESADTTLCRSGR